MAQPRAATENGAVLEKAVRDKQTKYEDVAESPLADLVVLACEVGGRWHDEALGWVRRLAKHKAREQHPLLRRSVELAWADRWYAMLGVCAQDALAASLLAHHGRKLVVDDNTALEPELDALLDGQRWATGDAMGVTGE